MKRIPMMLQLMLILFLVMAIPTVSLTWYSVTQTVRNSEHAIADSSLAELNTYRKLNENAMVNLSQNTVRLGGSGIFDQLRPIESFSELKTNFENLSKGMDVMEELAILNQSVDGVYSSYFYLSGADYVISTDKGITSLDKYESMDWLEEAYVEQIGIRGIWYARELDSGINVTSFILPLNRLSTATRGTIVVNLKESQIEQYYQSENSGKQEYYLMNADSIIISHPDKSKLLTSGKENPFIGEILEQGKDEGYTVYDDEGARMLYVWSRTEKPDWINISIYSLDLLLNPPHSLQNNLILLTVVIIFVGTVLAVFLSTWLSKPARELVRNMRINRNVMSRDKNEIAFLHSAFKRMQEEEEGLHRMLNEREQDARSLAIHNLLRGEVTDQIEEMFPEPNFLVAVVSIDGYRKYIYLNNPETRSYHRYLFISSCHQELPEHFNGRCIYQGNGCFAIVMNYGEEVGADNGSVIHAALDRIRGKATELLENSVTVGVSSPTDDSRLVSDQFVEAMEAIKHRIVAGSGRILYWKEESGQNIKYMYPLASEKRILNFLSNRDLDSIKKELDLIRQEIRNAEFISYDNILFIYCQLAGVTIKYLRENDVNTSKLFAAGQANIYASISSIDTLDELEEYFQEFYEAIVRYLGKNSGESNKYVEHILQYIHDHFSEEIVFEEMAKDIGISYSYMRKIVLEETGNSLIDYINQLRIDRAKHLLLESEMAIAQIASEVGYYNVRSFNRFFRKFEGVAPSTYKADRNQNNEN